MKEMIEKPGDIKQKGDQEKEKHERKPEITGPGKELGKMTGMGPFEDAGSYKGRGDQPETCNIEKPERRSGRNGLKGPDKNVIINKCIDCDYNRNK